MSITSSRFSLLRGGSAFGLGTAASRQPPPKPELKLEGEWWLQYSRKHQRKKAEREGRFGCRWVGGILYDKNGHQVAAAPAIPKPSKHAVGMGGGQPVSQGPRPPSYMRAAPAAPLYRRESGRYY